MVWARATSSNRGISRLFITFALFLVLLSLFWHRVISKLKVDDLPPLYFNVKLGFGKSKSTISLQFRNTKIKWDSIASRLLTSNHDAHDLFEDYLIKLFRFQNQKALKAEQMQAADFPSFLPFTFLQWTWLSVLLREKLSSDKAVNTKEEYFSYFGRLWL